MDGIARKNGIERWQVQQATDQLIQERLLQRNGMSGEFKRAIFNLIGARLSPTGLLAAATPHVLTWLCGTLLRIQALKPAMLYRRITRQNGRQMLESLSRWLRDCGLGGLVICIDIAAVTATNRESIGQRYSRVAAVDFYELLRQFIDATDLLEGLVLVFLAEEAFADDDYRGLNIYPALKMRLADDVHDAKRANPFAPMVRVVADV